MLLDELIHDEDIKGFEKLLEEFKGLQEIEYSKAFELQKKALIMYDRWSYILFEIRKREVGRKDAAIKDRVKQILETLDKVYVSSRIVFTKGKEDSVKPRNY